MTGQLTASDMTSEAVLSVPDFFAAAAEVMAERGWIKGTCAGPNGEVCEVGAVLKVVCTPGDQHLALEVLSHRGGGVDHNDHPGNTAEGSLKLLRSLGPITEAVPVIPHHALSDAEALAKTARVLLGIPEPTKDVDLLTWQSRDCIFWTDSPFERGVE